MNRSLKIPYIAHASSAQLVRHWTPKPIITSCTFLLLLPPANEVWVKVIFSQASVCPQGDVCGRHSPKQTPSPGRHPPGRHTPWVDTPGRHPPQSDMATEAGDMHPTGMHSCEIL